MRFGSLLGNTLGQIGGGLLGGDKGRDVGGAIGGALGSLAPFKKGGKVKGVKGKPVIILAHGQEIIIPNSMPALQKIALKAINKKKKQSKK